MKESFVLRSLLTILRENLIYHVRILSASRAGAPDVIICADGMFLAIECKSSRGRQSKLQELTERSVHRSRGAYCVMNAHCWEFLLLLEARSKDEVLNAFRRIAHAHGGSHGVFIKDLPPSADPSVTRHGGW